MPPMKVQPIDSPSIKYSIRTDSAKPLFKSRLRRLFDRQLPCVLRISSNEKSVGVDNHSRDAAHPVTADFEPSSICLDKMVQNYIEDSNDRQSATAAPKFGRNRCNCFNGNGNDSSDDEFDSWNDTVSPPASSGDVPDILKTLVPCASVTERNLLADTAKIVEQNKSCKRKDDLRTIVTEGLSRLGHDASICISRWENTSSFPAGEYEYIDVIVSGERLLIDVEFRSEFEIARSTGTYKAFLQSLPYIFVGKADRLQQIVSIASEAAKQSLKKKGMHIAPWRKAEYMTAKWLSPYTRTSNDPPQSERLPSPRTTIEKDVIKESEIEGERKLEESNKVEVDVEVGELDLIFGDLLGRSLSEGALEEVEEEEEEEGEEQSGNVENLKVDGITIIEEEKRSDFPIEVPSPWRPPVVKPRSYERGSKVVVTGLATLLRQKP